MNELTHTTMHELFGLTDMTMMVHLSRMARAERVLAADGADSYLPNLERSADRSPSCRGARTSSGCPSRPSEPHALLVTELGPDLFSRVVLDGYGHQDVFIGADAARDTFRPCSSTSST